MLLYPATVRPDGNSFTLIFPDVPGAHTNGNSREDALAHASDALHTAISMLMEKFALYRALRSRGVRKTELARRMGIHKQQVDRLLDIDHASRTEQLESAFAALQMRLTVDVQPAADIAA